MIFMSMKSSHDVFQTVLLFFEVFSFSMPLRVIMIARVYVKVMNTWKSYMRTAGWRIIWKKIIAVIGTTLAVAIKRLHLYCRGQGFALWLSTALVWQRSRVWIPYKLEFFLRLSFCDCKSCVYNLVDLLSFKITFLGVTMFWALLRTHCNPHLAGKMTESAPKHIYGCEHKLYCFIIRHVCYSPCSCGVGKGWVC